MGMSRRGFLGAAACVLQGVTASASLVEDPWQSKAPPDAFGCLVDMSACIGCRMCEAACAEEHDLPIPDIGDKTVFEASRRTSPSRFTVVNRIERRGKPVFVKRQCMHCVQPSCAYACLVKAMRKTREGPVVWNQSNCMGCRYCMVACPFNVPKFEYDSAVPRIRKCDMCWPRLKEGRAPACVANCPAQALLFGKRKSLLEYAKGVIHRQPGRYVSDIYGEREVGGTGWIYLSPVPFEEIGFRMNLGTTPPVEHTKPFLYAVPVVFLLGPALLFGLSQASRKPDDADLS